MWMGGAWGIREGGAGSRLPLLGVCWGAGDARGGTPTPASWPPWGLMGVGLPTEGGVGHGSELPPPLLLLPRSAIGWLDTPASTTSIIRAATQGVAPGPPPGGRRGEGASGMALRGMPDAGEAGCAVVSELEGCWAMGGSERASAIASSSSSSHAPPPLNPSFLACLPPRSDRDGGRPASSCACVSPPTRVSRISRGSGVHRRRGQKGGGGCGAVVALCSTNGAAEHAAGAGAGAAPPPLLMSAHPPARLLPPLLLQGCGESRCRDTWPCGAGVRARKDGRRDGDAANSTADCWCGIWRSICSVTASDPRTGPPRQTTRSTRSSDPVSVRVSLDSRRVMAASPRCTSDSTLPRHSRSFLMPAASCLVSAGLGDARSRRVSRPSGRAAGERAGRSGGGAGGGGGGGAVDGQRIWMTQWLLLLGGLPGEADTLRSCRACWRGGGGAGGR